MSSKSTMCNIDFKERLKQFFTSKKLLSMEILLCVIQNLKIKT